MFLVALIVDIISFLEIWNLGGFFAKENVEKNQSFQTLEHFQKSEIAVV